MRVCENIYLFGGEDGSSNIYVIDDYLLVDTGLEDTFTETLDNMKSEGLSPEEIKIILNTHGHYDHIGGNKKFMELSKAELYASEPDAENIEKGHGTYCDFFNKTFTPSSVDKKLKEGNKIKTPNHTFEVIYTPGHTKGGICLYEPDKKMLISGDTLFANAVGRTDLYGGSEKELIDSLKKLKKLDIELLLPGHGNIVKCGIEKMINEMLKELECK